MASELRIIDADGGQAGIMLREAALSFAERQGFDLVLISPNADPPVAKVMDYGKYRYDQQKREKEAKKKQKIIEVKEIRLSTFIDQHDLEIKGNMAKRFLTEGDKLKVSLRFKGRERGRTERGFEVMDRFTEVIREYGTPEKRAALEGRSLIMIVNPLPPKKEKAAPDEEAPVGDAALGVPQNGQESTEVAAPVGDAALGVPMSTEQAATEELEQAAPEEAKAKVKKPKGPSDEMDL